MDFLTPDGALYKGFLIVKVVDESGHVPELKVLILDGCMSSDEMGILTRNPYPDSHFRRR